MSFLLDTDTFSALLSPRVPSSLLARLTSVPPPPYLSSISLGEVLYGLYRRREAQSGRLQRLPQVLSRFEVLPFDEQAAEHYGSLYALLERLGTPIGTGDTQIAAIALSRDLTVVTGNVRHFSRVPNLPVENWLP